jgi:hypothetical protein
MVSKQEWAQVCEILRESQKKRFGLGALERVAGELDKTYRTWSVELSPFQETHKLGLLDVLNALDYCHDFQPFFSFLLNRYGYHIAPNPGADVPTCSLDSLMTRITKEAGDVAACLLKINDPASEAGERITPEEARHMLKEVDDLIRVAFGIKARLEEITK